MTDFALDLVILFAHAFEGRWHSPWKLDHGSLGESIAGIGFRPTGGKDKGVKVCEQLTLVLPSFHALLQQTTLEPITFQRSSWETKDMLMI